MPIFSIVWLSLILTIFSPLVAKAQESDACAAADKNCLLTQIESLTAQITETHWKDQTYREIAKLLAAERQAERAIGLIARIENPDTKAMTIRGIGMEAAKLTLPTDEYEALFAALRTEAEKIEHPPSYAIALTYIAMAQAFAGDDAGAMRTANDMENGALRNKAHAESAEIQAERGDPDAAMASIGAIDSASFRDKAYRTISKIFADRQKFDESLQSAMAIENSYQKAQAVLYLLAKQIAPEQVSLVE